MGICILGPQDTHMRIYMYRTIGHIFDQYVRTISICTDDFNMYVGGRGGGRGTDYHYTHKEGKRCIIGDGQSKFLSNKLRLSWAKLSLNWICS